MDIIGFCNYESENKIEGNRMSEQVPEKFDGVSVVCKANVYFDGKVVSHTINFPDGSTKSTGLMYAGNFTFNTEAAERMDIIAGECRVKIAGEDETKTYAAGSFFEIASNSSFDIEITDGIAEYVCSYL
jgi:purine/pyrimidine-nucleoside phosphorylase